MALHECGSGALTTDITPSNSSPVSLLSGGDYHTTASGYAISSYTSKTPNDSNPPSVSSGSIIKVSSYSGYLYKTQQGIKHNTNNITFNDNTTYHYVATGQFIGCKITRASAATAPTVQVFVKEGSSYTAVSAATQTANGEKTFYTTSLASGELYIKKNSGSTFTTTAFDFMYL